MTIFNWLDQLLVNKKPWNTFSDTDKKSFNVYMINRWLSMDDDFIEIVGFFQQYSIGLLQPKEVYKWYCDVLPKGKRFNKYIKGKKTTKYDEFLIDIIRKHFECNKIHAIEYIELLDKQELKEILEIYGTDKKQIKKVLK